MDGVHTEYWELYKKYTRDRLSALADTNLTCEGCPNSRQYIESPDSLIYSCGSVTSKNSTGPCGEQFKITLPRYREVHGSRDIYHEDLHGSLRYQSYTDDIGDMSPYPVDVLSTLVDIPLDQEVTMQTKYNEDIHRNLQDINEMYVTQNKDTEIMDQIKELCNFKQA